MAINYKMGFSINGVPIPDPSSFKGAQSDLDTLGERDASGNIRRNKVAMKCHVNLEWNGIFWETMKEMGGLMNKGDRFQFTYPDPIEGAQTIIAYCGDRNWEAKKCVDANIERWIGDFKVNIIEI